MFLDHVGGNFVGDGQDDKAYYGYSCQYVVDVEHDVYFIVACKEAENGNEDQVSTGHEVAQVEVPGHVFSDHFGGILSIKVDL